MIDRKSIRRKAIEEALRAQALVRNPEARATTYQRSPNSEGARLRSKEEEA